MPGSSLSKDEDEDDDVFQDAREEPAAPPREAPGTTGSPNSDSDAARGSETIGLAHNRMPSIQYEDATPRGDHFRLASFDHQDFALHRAVFRGDISAALELLKGMSKSHMVALDPQGNTALHIAVLRRRASVVLALLDAGFPPDAQNARRWTALDDAISLKDKELVKVLHARQTAALKAELKAKKGELLASLEGMPDISFQLKWELGSPVLGMLLRKYAPHDVYEVWKRGSKMRVDGSLMGLDDKNTGLLPQWKRGHFSLLFDGATTPATILLCDHVKKKYLDLNQEKKKHKPSIDEEASMIISEGAGKTKLRASEFHFKAQKGWFGGTATENIEGWKTRIYEAAGKMVSVTINKLPLAIPKHATWDEYLALQVPEDEVSEAPVDPYSLDTHPGKPIKQKSGSPDLEKKKPKVARRMTGKCWMAEDFPMSLTQLLPVLEVIGNANKHIARVAKFLHKYGDMSLFPVKLQVPLMYTVYALISFRKFKTLQNGQQAEESQKDSWYALPKGYTQNTFDEIAASRQRSQRLSSFDEGENLPVPEEVQKEDARILKEMGL